MVAPTDKDTKHIKDQSTDTKGYVEYTKEHEKGNTSVSRGVPREHVHPVGLWQKQSNQPVFGHFSPNLIIQQPVVIR